MKIKETPINTIIEYLNDFCIKTGIHISDSQEMIARTMQEVNGVLYFGILKQTFSEYLSGQIDIKPPYKLNNLFISQLINKHFELKRSEPKPFQDQIEIIPPTEEINKIFEIGIKESRVRLKSFLRGDDKYFDCFFLFNEYQWLIDNKGMNPNDYTDEEINRMVNVFMKYDQQTCEQPGRMYTPVMTLIEYQKAAIVALFLKS